VQPVWLKILQVLAERNFISDADELIPSERSVGKEISLMETTTAL
jgi:hypothetical protein